MSDQQDVRRERARVVGVHENPPTDRQLDFAFVDELARSDCGAHGLGGYRFVRMKKVTIVGKVVGCAVVSVRLTLPDRRYGRGGL